MRKLLLLLTIGMFNIACQKDDISESLEVNDVVVENISEEESCINHSSKSSKRASKSSEASVVRTTTGVEQIHSDLTVDWPALTQQKIDRFAFMEETRHRNGPIVNLFTSRESYTSPYRNIDVTDSQTFVAAFIQEAYDWGIDIRADYANMVTIPYSITVYQEESNRKAVGSTYERDDRYQIQISLNSNHYRYLDFAGGMKVLYHELGHDILDLGHVPDGIMNSYYWLTTERFAELKSLFWSKYVWAAYTNFSERSRSIRRDPIEPGTPNHASNWRPNFLKPLNVITEVGPDWIKVSGDVDSFGPGGLAMYEIAAWGTPSAGYIDRIVGDKIYIKGAVRRNNRVATRTDQKMISTMAIPPEGMPTVGQRILLTKNRL